jgi:hypothetical protein
MMLAEKREFRASIIGLCLSERERIMTRQRILDILWMVFLIAIVTISAWIILRPAPRAKLTTLSGIICTPTKRLPGGALPEPPPGWHYRADDRLETDAK